MRKLYIDKLKFNEGLDCYMCLDDDEKPIYSARSLDNALQFAAVYLHKLDVKEFSIIYRGGK